ncbi:MAG: O-antigen ligase family protein, partial [Bacteroidales bacterium]|nr:O-antigen ligase family protein [Bacteroidales bacterium]
FALLLVFLLTRFKQDSVSGRMLIWKVTTQMALDKPVFGHGFNSFTTKYNDYQALYFKANPNDKKNALLADNSTYAFNEYLNVWAELGTIGLLLFLLILAWVVKFIFTRKMANKKSHILISEGILIAIAVSSLFSYPLHNIPVWLAFMLALVTLSAQGNPVKQFKINRQMRIIGNLALLVLIVYIQADSIEKYQAQKDWKNVVMEVQKGRKDMAFREYKKLKNELGYSPYFMYNYGAELCVAKRYKESLAVLKETETLLNDADFYIYIGTAYEGLGRIKKAISSFEKSSQIAPVKYYPRYKLVHLYHQTGDYMKANDMAHVILGMPVKVESETVTQIKKEMEAFVEGSRQQ